MGWRNMPVKKTINITEEQDLWLKENYISLSKLVQAHLKFLMSNGEA